MNAMRGEKSCEIRAIYQQVVHDITDSFNPDGNLRGNCNRKWMAQFWTQIIQLASLVIIK